MAYFTNVGPANDPSLARDARGAACGVPEAPNDHMPIGAALPGGAHADGVEVWRLFVHGASVTGRWIVIDRTFREADPGSTRPTRPGP